MYCKLACKYMGFSILLWSEATERSEAALMHDIGKLVTPIEVMNKETRLEGHLDKVLQRFRYIGLLKKIAWLEGTCTEKEYEEEAKCLEQAAELVLKINKADFLEPEAEEWVKRLGERTYIDADGAVLPYLEPKEQKCLLIRKGTLTDTEREAMKQHVVFTDRFLAAMNFDEHYKDVRSWASKHHEHLDGTGYPKGLSGGKIPNEVRLLTIVDIYDALVSEDRPYKKAHTKEAAFEILFHMAEDGKLDTEILKRFQAAVEWKEHEFCL